MRRRSIRASSAPVRPTKKIHQNSVVGEQGIHLIGLRTLDMGFLWHARGSIDAGIDGEIEIRDDMTGEVHNLIIHVQSKATQKPFTAETEHSFEYLCDERDLGYWLNGNAPVILVVSRPSTNEAYWVSIKDYFKDLSRIKARKIFFDKRRDQFDRTCRDALVKLAVSKDSGVYLAPLPQMETLYTNLLSVSAFAEHIYIAETDCRTTGEVFAALRTVADGEHWNREWFLKNGRMISFCDLDEHPWNTICDAGTVECIEAREWAFSSDEEQQRDFVQLLNRSLRELLAPIVTYSDRFEYFYFTASKSLSPRIIAYSSLQKEVTRTVFKEYVSKTDSTKTAYYRHSAFKGAFKCYDNTWYLEITPTYHFSRDGRVIDGYYEQRLKKIKQLERNQAVLGQLLMWAAYIKRARTPDLFNKGYTFLQFGDLLSLEIEAGINDTVWLSSEEDGDKQHISDSLDQLELMDL